MAVPFDQIKFVNEPVAYTGASSSSSKSTTTTGASNEQQHGAYVAQHRQDRTRGIPTTRCYNATKDQLKAMPEFKYST